MQNTAPHDVCSFCGTIGDEHTRYAAGFGVIMCSDCVTYFSDALDVARREATAGSPVPGGRRRALTRYDLDQMSNEQVLEMLPRIAGSVQLVNRFLADWVEQIRLRKLSWTTIGTAMGISRQAAWERFTRVLGTDSQQPTSF